MPSPAMSRFPIEPVTATVDWNTLSRQLGISDVQQLSQSPHSLPQQSQLQQNQPQQSQPEHNPPQQDENKFWR